MGIFDRDAWRTEDLPKDDRGRLLNANTHREQQKAAREAKRQEAHERSLGIVKPGSRLGR